MASAGDTLKQFRLLEPIGKGGMGEVFLAEDTALDRKVALKFLPEALREDPVASERFLREAKSAAALDHPYICKIYEIGKVEGKAFIAMEYVDGKTLQEKIKDGPLRLGEILEVGAEIAEAVEAAHEKQIVHRDLKTANIMVTREGHAKVLDFGVAKQLAMDVLSESRAETYSGRLSSQDTTPGTVIYMSPEQVRGEPVDQRTDVFSLGVVLYEMATAELPFQGATSGLTYDAILNRGPTPPRQLNPGVPEELERVILKALEKDVEHRYQTAKDLKVDLRRLKRDTDTVPPGGAESTARPARPAGAERTTRRWLVAAAAAAAAALGYLWLAPSERTGGAIDSLAVLPFENAQNDPDVDYLSDGIAENLINQLSELPQLRVMARSTSFRYRGADVDLANVGRELDVGAVLTGRVVQQDHRLNVQTELVDVARGTQLWGEQYSYEMDDILSLQNEIAREIADALRLRLTGEEERQLALQGTESSAAFQAYMKGRHLVGQRTEAGFTRAIEFFEQARAEDSEYALPLVGLADSFLLLGAYYGTGVVPGEAMEKARSYARRALRLDPNLAEAYVSLAYIEFLYDWEWEAAERDFQRAIELDPTYAVAHQWYGEYLTVLGRHDEAIAATRRAVDLEPTSAIISRELAYKYLMARRYPEAIEQYHKTLELDPSFVGTHERLVEAYWYSGMTEEALEEARHLDEAPKLVYELLAEGKEDEAAALVDTMKNQRIPVLARYYALVGRKGEALDLLEEAVSKRLPQVLVTQAQPVFDPYRSEPRFTAFRETLGLPP